MKSFQIYPYWNVNLNTHQAPILRKSLSNLSILECKSLKIKGKVSGSSSFQIYPYWNVNCKYTFAGCTVVVFQIYPYWNVNGSNISTYFSLYIFQIYPYWNVNHHTIRKCYQRFSFQIYPYWNVNVFQVPRQPSDVQLSNLSILECKYIICYPFTAL